MLLTKPTNLLMLGSYHLGTGKGSDLENPLLHISGSGQVHGHPQNLSSSRGELQGIMVIQQKTYQQNDWPQMVAESWNQWPVMPGMVPQPLLAFVAP
jgi:hypothetical protein